MCFFKKFTIEIGHYLELSLTSTSRQNIGDGDNVYLKGNFTYRTDLEKNGSKSMNWISNLKRLEKDQKSKRRKKRTTN